MISTALIIIIIIIIIIIKWKREFGKVPMQCPIVLLLKVGWHDKTLGSQERKVPGSGLLGVGGKGQMSFWADFLLQGNSTTKI
jgi:hypothetical protein